MTAAAAPGPGPLLAACVTLVLALAAPPGAAQDDLRIVDQRRLDATTDLAGFLGPQDAFGSSLASLGDLDGDGTLELAVGAIADDEGAPGAGAVWILSLDGDGLVGAPLKINDVSGELPADLENGDQFGAAVAAIGDVDGDGLTDLAVGAPGTDSVQASTGAVWVLMLEEDGGVRDAQRITALDGGLFALLASGDRFGSAVTPLGDLDMDGVPDLAVGALGDDGPGDDRGAVWLLFLRADGTVRTHRKLSSAEPPLDLLLDDGDNFGVSLAPPVNGELLVGATHDDDGGVNRGAVWRLTLTAVGDLLAVNRISQEAGGFGGQLADWDHFGGSLSRIDDMNGDGLPDLAVGAAGTDVGGDQRGALWLLALDAAGQVVEERVIDDASGDFFGPLTNGDAFGNAVAPLGDLDGDGLGELAVGAFLTDAVFLNDGAVWSLELARLDALLTLGDRVEGSRAAGEVHRFGFDGSSRTTLRAVARVPGGGEPPVLRLFGPDGGVLAESVATGTSARLLDVELPITGSYRIEVDGPAGPYKLRTRGRTPRTLTELVTLAPGDLLASVTVPAVAGTRLRSVRIKSPAPKKDLAFVAGEPAALLPALVSGVPGVPAFDPASVVTSPSGKLVKAGPVDLEETADYRIVVGAVDGSVGFAKVRVKLRAPKGKARLQLP